MPFLKLLSFTANAKSGPGFPIRAVKEATFSVSVDSASLDGNKDGALNWLAKD